MNNLGNINEEFKNESYESNVDYDSNVKYSNSLLINDFISNNICNNEDANLKEFQTHYIYIESPTTHVQREHSESMDTYIIFNNDNNKKIITNIVNTIKDLCNKKNIIIYISLQYNKTSQFIQLFNQFVIENLSIDSIYYNNIIIISFFYFKDIQFNLNIHSLMTQFVYNIEKGESKTFFKILNVYYDNSPFPSSPYKIRSMNQPKQQLMIFEFMKFNNKIDYLISERRCSSGKLIQFTGTCWMNAIMNALLLPRISRKRMIEQCKFNIKHASPNNRIKYTLSLNNLYKYRNNLTSLHIINAIIYNIFIKKQRLKREAKTDPSKNFMLLLAYKAKKEAFNNNLNLLNKYQLHLKTDKKNIDFGNGGFQDLPFEVLNNINNLYFTNNNILLINRGDLGISTPNGGIKKEINKGGRIYKLSSCYIRLFLTNSERHAICGFICGDKEYIYDSNTQHAIESNWTNKHIHDDYLALKLYNILSIEFAEFIYILEEEEKEKPHITPPPPPPPPQTQQIKCPSTHEIINNKCYKKCNKNHQRNQKTNRCSKIKPPPLTNKSKSQSSLTKKRKTSPDKSKSQSLTKKRKTSPTKIQNCPSTHEMSNDGKCHKKCNENQHRNEDTNRCNKNK
jgi:hypothetical protein